MDTRQKPRRGFFANHRRRQRLMNINATLRIPPRIQRPPSIPPPIPYPNGELSSNPPRNDVPPRIQRPPPRIQRPPSIPPRIRYPNGELSSNPPRNDVPPRIQRPPSIPPRIRYPNGELSSNRPQNDVGEIFIEEFHRRLSMKEPLFSDLPSDAPSDHDREEGVIATFEEGNGAVRRDQLIEEKEEKKSNEIEQFHNPLYIPHLRPDHYENFIPHPHASEEGLAWRFG
eukprot:559943_1